MNVKNLLLLFLFCGSCCFADVLHLEDSCSRFSFDKKNGALRGIFSKTAGVFPVKKGNKSGIFELSLKKTGYIRADEVKKITAENCSLLSQKITSQGKKKILTQSYLLPDQKSRFTCHMIFDEKQYSSWQIVSIENNSGMEIFEVAFPVIGGIDLAGKEMLFRGGMYYVLSDPFKYRVLGDVFPSRAPFPVLDIY